MKPSLLVGGYLIENLERPRDDRAEYSVQVVLLAQGFGRADIMHQDSAQFAYTSAGEIDVWRRLSHQIQLGDQIRALRVGRQGAFARLVLLQRHADQNCRPRHYLPDLVLDLRHRRRGCGGGFVETQGAIARHHDFSELR
jgi:hypothetical protein